MKKIIVLLIAVVILNISPVIAEVGTNASADGLPSSFDWRDVNGIDYTTHVKNQAPSPTCEAYALCAALETIVQYQVGYPFDCDLSETHLFFYSGGSIDWGGVYLPDAADYLVEYGVPDEGCFPDPHRPYDGPFESLPGWENRTVKITEWGWVENEEDSIKQALIEYGPLVLCMYTRNNLLRYRRGIYMPRGRIVWGHVVTIVGYDDEERCWIIKNSAGERWGEEGYIRVSYDADSPDHPFVADFYGGTGILYVDGVYGNFMPDVPKIQIETPEIYNTYFFGFKFPTIFKRLPFQKAAPRIIGKNMVKINATNTNKVEFYLDGELKSVVEELPYEWEIHAPRGLHTIEALAYNEGNVSKDIIDVFVFT